MSVQMPLTRLQNHRTPAKVGPAEDLSLDPMMMLALQQGMDLKDVMPLLMLTKMQALLGDREAPKKKKKKTAEKTEKKRRSLFGFDEEADGEFEAEGSFTQIS